MQTGPMRRKAGSAWLLLRDRNFGPFFFGNLLSNCGTWFQNIALVLLIYRLTQSPFFVGLVNFAQFLGVILLAPVAGPAADRWDRKRVLVATQMGSAVLSAALAALTAAGWVTTQVALSFAFGLGLLTAFAIPALQAFVPSLVERHDLASAVALNSVTFNAARVIGPVVGALVVARFGIATAFAVNSLSYLALVAALSFIRVRRVDAPRPSSLGYRESLHLLGRNRRMLTLLGVVAAVSVTIDPVTTLAPSFATDVFGRSDVTAGLLIGAFGLGAIAAAFFVVQHRGGRQIEVMLGTAAMGIVLFGISTRLHFGLAALTVAGVGYLAAQTAATTELHLNVDESQRGRVMSLWTVAFLGVRPIASVADGGIASAFGPHTAAVVMALPALGLAGALAIRRLKPSRLTDELESMRRRESE